MDELRNRGVWTLHPPDDDAREKTVIVLGVARGGTSMVAAALQHLGVYMGERLGVVHEDAELGAAIERKDGAALDRIIAERNAAHAVWGWKRPDAIRYCELWRHRFRNPYYVAIFRDLFAIANRNRISMRSDVVRSMRHLNQIYAQIVNFVESVRAPVLLVSYEKALREPEFFVAELRNFVKQGDEAQVRQAIESIRAEPPEYLETTRITAGRVAIGTVGRRRIRGWAFLINAPENPAQVEIDVNGKRRYTVVANQFRPRLKDIGIHPTGRCGFELVLPEGEELRTGDRVSARVAGDVRAAEASPRIFRLPDPEGTVPAADAGASCGGDRPASVADGRRPVARSGGRAILIAGLAKTGTTALLFKVAHAVEGNKHILFEPARYLATPEDASRTLVCKILIGRHLDVPSFAGFKKKITLLRDPRDRLVSELLYRMYHHTRVEDDAFVAAFRTLLERKERDPHSVPIVTIIRMTGEAAGLSDPVNRFMRHIAASHDAFEGYLRHMTDTLIFRYEDMVCGRFEALEDYLELSLARNAQVPPRWRRVVRTMRSGDWVNWFTPDDVDAFAPLLTPFIVRHGYDPAWNLPENPAIEPSHCSEYVMRLIEERRVRLRDPRLQVRA